MAKAVDERISRMPVPRSRSVPEAGAVQALSAAYGLWAPAVSQAHEATEAAARHWRALVDLQITAADEAYRLAASHAERRTDALNRMLQTLWPAQPAKAPADV
jgi:hypothetical protein